MGQTNSLLDKLNAQAANQVNYPNIQANTYNNLQRILLRYWLRTYGVSYSLNGVSSTTSSAIGSATANATTAKVVAAAQAAAQAAANPVPASNFSNPTSFLVLAVHGSISAVGGTTGGNVGATGNNVIYIANHMYSFPPGTPLTLNTPNNQGVPVTVKGYKGNGAIEVNEDLVLDILSINSGGTDYQTNYASFPNIVFNKNLQK